MFGAKRYWFARPGFFLSGLNVNEERPQTMVRRWSRNFRFFVEVLGQMSWLVDVFWGELFVWLWIVGMRPWDAGKKFFPVLGERRSRVGIVFVSED